MATRAVPSLVPQWRLERRVTPGGAVRYRVGAIIIGVLLSVFAGIALSDASISDFFADLWRGTFGTERGLENLTTLAVPLILTGLAASIPYRLGLWNIGAEGQLFLGAWAGTAIAFALPDLAGPLLIALMLLAAATGGAVWVLAPALARVYLGVNEIISTLLLNFVAAYWVLYWAGGRWLDPLSTGGVRSERIPEQSELPGIPIGSSAEIPVGFLIAVGTALILAAIVRATAFGYEISLFGASARASEYAGMRTKRLMVTALLVGGAMGGLAGAIVMLADVHRFGPALSNNTGYAGITIALLAAGSELGVVVIALLFAVVTVGGGILRVEGASSELIFAMFGATLIFAAMGQGLAHIRLVRRRSEVADGS